MFLDPQDLMARAIRLAHKGKNDEAAALLFDAARMDPTNPRVWLWLAAARETPEDKRECLERVLALVPDHPMALALLKRLTPSAAPDTLINARVQTFTCPQCGGRQRFDPDLSTLLCVHCGSGERLALPDASDDEKGLTVALYRPSAAQWALHSGQMHCENCGATTALAAHHATLTCPFCASNKVLVQPLTAGLLPPNAIAPFAINENEARHALRAWLEQGWLTPADLRHKMASEALRAVYLPFWTFDGNVQVRCADRQQPQEFSDEERVLRAFTFGSNRDHSSWYEREFDDMLVYASRALPLEVMHALLPFDLKSLVAYRPEVLAGWQTEVYQLPLADAALEAQKQMRDAALQAAEKRGLIRAHTLLLAHEVRTVERTYKLILLPVWITTYMYRGQRYPLVVNGQTGQVAGQKPIEWWKVALLVAGGIVVLLMILIVLRRG